MNTNTEKDKDTLMAKKEFALQMLRFARTMAAITAGTPRATQYALHGLQLLQLISQYDAELQGLNTAPAETKLEAGVYEIPFPVGTEFSVLPGYAPTKDATAIAEACDDNEWNWMLATHDGNKFTHADFMLSDKEDDRIRVHFLHDLTWENVSFAMWRTVSVVLEHAKQGATVN